MEKTVIRTVAEGTAWVSGSTLLLKVLSLATVFIMLTRLDAGAYGALELALSITSLLSIFLLPGLDGLVTADMAAEIGKGESKHARAIAKSYLTIQILMSVVAFGIVLLSAPLFAGAYHLPVYYVQLVALLFLSSPFRSVYAIVFRVNLSFFLQSLSGFLEEFTKFVLLLVLFITGFLGVAGVIIAILLSQLLPVLLLSPWFLRIWNSYTHGTGSELVQWRHFVWGNSAWGIASTYLGSFGRSARLWVVERTLGHEAVGLYAVASGLIGHTVALVPLNTIITPILPRYANDPKRFARLFLKAVKYQSLGYISIGIVAFFVFPPILSLMFPKYISAFPLFRIMLIGLLPGAIIAIITPAFFALRMQKSFFFSLSLKVFTSVGFTYLGAILFGLNGLAYESILTSIVQTAERMRSLRKRIPEIGQPYTGILSIDDDDRLIFERIKVSAGRVLHFVSR